MRVWRNRYRHVPISNTRRCPYVCIFVHSGSGDGANSANLVTKRTHGKKRRDSQLRSKNLGAISSIDCDAEKEPSSSKLATVVIGVPSPCPCHAEVVVPAARTQAELLFTYRCRYYIYSFGLLLVHQLRIINQYIISSERENTRFLHAWHIVDSKYTNLLRIGQIRRIDTKWLEPGEHVVRVCWCSFDNLSRIIG